MEQTLKTFYVIYLKKILPDGRVEKHPVMQKTGEKEVALLAWSSQEKASLFLEKMNLDKEIQFSVDLEDELILLKLRKKHEEMDYQVLLKIQE
ncbi:MAG: hypothetical protein JW969_09825 [Spirochaetales bacterium]|nr:hypothetical protein [Spirochaetales bacterium]